MRYCVLFALAFSFGCSEQIIEDPIADMSAIDMAHEDMSKCDDGFSMDANGNCRRTYNPQTD